MSSQDRLRQRAAEHAVSRSLSAVEVELKETMSRMVEELISGLPHLSRQDALADLVFRANRLLMCEKGEDLPAVEGVESLEKACATLQAQFAGMTRKLALGQLVYDLSRAARAS